MPEIYDSKTTNIATLAELVQNSDIIIIEGFEFVGKNYLIKNLYNVLYERDLIQMGRGLDMPRTLVYRPDYDLIEYERITSVQNRYVLRLPIMELFPEIWRAFRPRKLRLILDKSIFSDAVYSKLVATEDVSIDEMLSVYHRLVEGWSIAIIHVSPYTSNPHQLVNAESILGKFSSFEEYFIKLNSAEILFNDVYTTYINMFSKDNVKLIKYYIDIEIPEEE